MARRKRERTRFWTQPAMVPTEAGEQAGQHARRAKRWRRLVMACTVTFPIMVITLMLVVAQSIVGEADTSTSAGAEVPTQVRAEALDAVGDWLASETSPLSDAQVLGWDRAESVPWPENVDDEDRTHTVWAAHVLVSTSAGIYDAGVQVNYEPSTGATVVGAPSLLPVPVSRDISSEISLWPGTTSVAASEATTRAVEAWAQAYTSGDADALATVVSDPDASHRYSPISGFTHTTTQVEIAAYRAYNRGDKPDTSLLMVSVTLYAQREGQDKPSQLSFDLLVSDPTTGAARVTAWGSPGSGPNLKPYENAVVVASDSASGGTPSTTPTPTQPSQPSPSAEPSTSVEPSVPDEPAQEPAPEGAAPMTDEGQ